MLKFLKESPESMSLPYRTEAYTSAWNDLKAGTAYYALAIAKNGNNEWGPLTKVEFTTLAGK